MSSIMSTAGFFGILAMMISFVFAMVVLGHELRNKEYRDYGAKNGCYLNTTESERIYEWTLVLLFMWVLTQASAGLKYAFKTREFFEKNDMSRRALNVVFVVAGQLYLGALFLVATHFEWGLTCNNHNNNLHGANMLWGSAGLWILGVSAMHAMPGKRVSYVDDRSNGEARVVWRSAHEVSGLRAQEMGSLLKR